MLFSFFFLSSFLSVYYLDVMLCTELGSEEAAFDGPFQVCVFAADEDFSGKLFPLISFSQLEAVSLSSSQSSGEIASL